MHCPRCGQQQVSDEMKFCSRCGLPISGLAEWVAGGGVPATNAAVKKISAGSPRRKGIRLGAKVMFLSGVLLPVFLAISLAVDEGGPMILPVLVFFVGLTIMLYSRLFREDIPSFESDLAQTSRLAAVSEASALPPASNIPIHNAVDFARQRVRTNELAQRPSVTEHTTKLLDQE
ncbi:MAG: zinc ribbon domain-containing protein [Pyrinomonadaceae bacterium]|nr:zinc ribbon domain-containing protein [Pyrinomonadaceae bacterium]